MNARRTDALRRMAHADESPNEASIARTKLAEAGVPIDPPPPPAPPSAAPMPEGWQFRRATTTVTFNGSSTTTGTIWVHFEGTL